MLRRSLFAAVVCLVGLSLAVARDDKKPDDKKPDDKNKAKATLAWKFEKGKPFYQKMTTKTEQTMKVQSQEVKQTQNQTFYFVYTPTEEKDGTWTITQEIEAVQMDIDIGGTKINFDSTKPETGSSPLGEFFKALVGSKFTLTVAPKDKDNKELVVTKIDGQKDFVEKLGKANPQMQPLLNQILSENALKEMATPTFSALPGKEVTQGDSWKRTVALDMGPIGKYETAYTYTYDGPDPKDAKLQNIKVEATLKYKEPTTEGSTGSLPFKIKKATLKNADNKPATGTIAFDPALGRIAKATMDLNLDGDLDIDIGGQTTKVDLTQKQTTTVENTAESQKPKAAPK